jgi:hypothetical protein
MKTTIRAALPVIYLCLFALSNSAQGFESAPYFPLHVGDYWNYNAWIKTGPRTSLPLIGLAPNSKKAGTKTVKIKSGDLFNGTRSVQADSKYSWDPMREISDLTNNFEGITLYAINREPNGGVSCEPFTRPLRYLPPAVELGMTYRANGDFPCGAGGQRWLFHWEVKIKVINFEEVTVPAGKFKSLKVERSVEYNYTLDPRLKQTDIDTIWLVDHVGVVKAQGRIVNSGSLGLVSEHAEELISTSLYGTRPVPLN